MLAKGANIVASKTVVAGGGCIQKTRTYILVAAVVNQV
jgi:hypothetical protein